MAALNFKHFLLTMPGIAVSLLPKLICPFCWPLYAAIVSSIGLGFLVGTKYLFPLTIVFLILTLGMLAFRAEQRRGYWPFVLGIAGSAALLIGKFSLESRPTAYGGVAVLMAAWFWNAKPRRVVACERCE